MKCLKFIDTLIRFFEKYVAIFLMLFVFFLLILQIIARYFFNHPLAWPEELLRFCFVAMIYLAISFAASQDAHIRIELQFQYMPKLLRFILLTTADLAWLFFNAVIIKVGIDVVVSLFKFPYISPVLRISMAYLYIIIPFGALIMSFRIIQNMILRMMRLTQLTEL